MYKKTRVAIFGATGMLGHKIWQIFKDKYETWAVARAKYHVYDTYGIFDPNRFVEDVDVFNFDSVIEVFSRLHPEVVINCIGIIKQSPLSHDPIVSITVNSLFPHRLYSICQATSARLIHISTDCVFSGQKGMYKEEDPSDAEDLYGRTKYLGEVSGPGCLTLRTSIIGRELKTSYGLVEWFLNNKDGKVRGFTNAYFSGLTTLALAKLLEDIINKHPQLEGLYHISSYPISKFELLSLLKNRFKVNIEIEPYPYPQINRSLDGTRFKNETGFVCSSWEDMIDEMANDAIIYNFWR